MPCAQSVPALLKFCTTVTKSWKFTRKSRFASPARVYLMSIWFGPAGVLESVFPSA